jgi:hypothetical protein
VETLSKNHSSGDPDCQCECVEELADQLKKHIGEQAFVFEKIGFVHGTIIKVINDSILVMENVSKVASFGNVTISTGAFELFISICEITEFAPFTAGISTVSTNLDQLNLS